MTQKDTKESRVGDAIVKGETPTIDFDLVSLNHPRSTYSVKTKLAVATMYTTTGNIKKAAEMANVPVGTAREWKRKASWWNEVCAEVRSVKNDELEAVLTEALHMASEQVLDRLEHGNTLVVNGELMRVPVPARELAQLTTVLFEKRSLLRGEPGRITESRKVDFDQLVDQFKAFNKEMAKGMEKTIN